MIPAAVKSNRRLRRRLEPAVARAAAVPGADRYRKHFPAHTHLQILLFHVLDGADSLRQTHARLAILPGAWARLGLPRGISRSQVARSSTSRPLACVEHLLADLIQQATRRRDPELHRLRQTQIVDSTVLTLSARLAPWSRYGKHAPGMRVQCGLDLAGQVPHHLTWSRADCHDARALKERDLTALAGWTLLIDLGYYGHQQFRRLRAAQVSFICPLHAQATDQVTTNHPVDPTPTAAGDVIEADATITLGSPNNRQGAVLTALRLVTSRNPDGVVHRWVTDRHDLTAAQVVTLYRQRWQIELFFRWLKHQLKLLQPLGHSPEAVWMTVLLAAIAATLAERDRPPTVTRVAWLRGLGCTLLLDPLNSS